MRRLLRRRELLTGFTSALLVAGTAGCASLPPGPRRGAPRLAITIDDFDLHDTPRLTADERHSALLKALKDHRIKAGGFPAGKMIDNEEGQVALARWAEAGHLLGNHSYAHSKMEKLTSVDAGADIARCEDLLRQYPTFRRLFRFPYLAEGTTANERDRLRAVLKGHGYRNAPVTIDTSDWFINSRLSKRLKADPKADVRPYRSYYLSHLWDRASFYQRLAEQFISEPIIHTLLLHHNLLNALFLADALAMFAAQGWRLIDAKEAFASPLLQTNPDSIPAGQSLIWGMAKERGTYERWLRYPAESDIYEKPLMDSLAL